MLKIQNAEGKHAFIGIAFNERNFAFDFNVAMQDFQKEKVRDRSYNCFFFFRTNGQMDKC